MQTLIARAEKAREDRQKERQRQRAALTVQSCFRAYLDLRRVTAAERRQFDESFADNERRRAILCDARSFCALTRSLLFFHKHKEPSDGERRRTILQMWLQATEGRVDDATTNPCVQLCSSVDGATTWQHQGR